ncbi:MAG: enoyl-CoA hydratase-related protein [Candidatus Nanopelagicales bacterium]
MRYEVADGVATLTLDNPDARNVLDVDTMAALSEGLDRAGSDPSVRVVVLTAEGRAFCAGADLKGAASADRGSFTSDGPGALVAVLEGLLDCPKPTIARVQGHVAGGGNGLVAACDFAVAADDVHLAFSEVRVGVAPAVISVVCLNRMHPRDGIELLLLGERVPAARAVQAGLVNRAVPRAELDEAVADYVRALKLGGPQALRATKNLLRRVPGMPRTEAFKWTAEVSAHLFNGDEAIAGMTAFLSKQPAPWVESD